jgi:hypothetical protein
MHHTSQRPEIERPSLLRGYTSTVSGLYHPDKKNPSPLAEKYSRIEVRFDIDGWYPQKKCSCTLFSPAHSVFHFTAELKKTGATTWKGSILKTFGGRCPFKKTFIIRLERPKVRQRPRLNISFSSTTGKRFTLQLRRSSKYYHRVTFEYDRIARIKSGIRYHPQQHPDRPSLLRDRKLDIAAVYQRAGFRVVHSSDRDVIPMKLAGSDREWSSRELHDAMQTYWSHFADSAQWSLWVLFANLYKGNFSVGGIMFDSSGSAQRQGVAVFNRAGVFSPPPGDSAPHAWRERMRFWTACHEIGHLFNLAHSWEKEEGSPWLPCRNSDDALSFMNYPSYYPGGEKAYFSDFTFRFEDDELLFMRHAPEPFVQMGNAAWFSNHAFEGRPKNETPFHLELRVTRRYNRFSFMEPVVLECKLKNMSEKPQTIDFSEASFPERITVALRRKGTRTVHTVKPFARTDSLPQSTNLKPKTSFYCSLFASAGPDGWLTAEPGTYIAKAYCTVSGRRLHSSPLQFTIDAPVSKTAEKLAREYFCDEVARVLAFRGSNSLGRGNDVLREITLQPLPDSVVRQARLALALPLIEESKMLQLSGKKSITTVRKPATEPDTIMREFDTLLLKNSFQAAENLGNLDYKRLVDEHCAWLVKNRQMNRAYTYQKNLFETLAARKVKPAVLSSILSFSDKLKKP